MTTRTAAETRDYTPPGGGGGGGEWGGRVAEDGDFTGNVTLRGDRRTFS